MRWTFCSPIQYLGIANLQVAVVYPQHLHLDLVGYCLKGGISERSKNRQEEDQLCILLNH